MAAKSLEDIQWQKIETPDRGMQLACSVGDAEFYMKPKLSRSGLLQVLDKYQVRRYSAGHGRVKYVLQIDLDEVNRLRSQIRIEDESAVSSEQLLEQAAQLLEQVQAGQTDTSAIAAWIKLYQSRE